MAESHEFGAFSAQYAQMLDAYRGQDWQAASAKAEGITVQADHYGLGKLMALYKERIAEFAVNPPEADWDGVFVSQSK